MEDYKVLLLSPNYEALNFINFKKAIKLICNNKVEIISTWNINFKLNINNIIYDYPSILKLNKLTKKNTSKDIIFNRSNLVRRDKYRCQYCNKFLYNREITIDHIIPKSLGGENSFLNCVISCHKCNNTKGNKTLDQCNLKLLRKPFIPTYFKFEPNLKSYDNVHSDWNTYI